MESGAWSTMASPISISFSCGREGTSFLSSSPTDGVDQSSWGGGKESAALARSCGPPFLAPRDPLLRGLPFSSWGRDGERYR